MRPVDAVIDFLKAEQARGKTHILLDDVARCGLRELYMRLKGKPANTSPTPETAAPMASAAAATSAATAAPTESAPAQATALPETAVVRETPAPAPAVIQVSGSTKAERLASLRQQAETWPPAKALGTLREIMVFASGNPDARLMLVGEAPGYEEERKKQPFVGPAGQKLNDILKVMGLSRDEVYLSTIVKFRPVAPRQTTNNRKPTPKEMAACLPFLREEINIIQPACIVALGGTAAEGLLDQTDSVASLRDSWHEFDGIPLRVSYHPSHLLRSQADVKTKREFWEDMLAIMEKLEMPISDKQRGFFLPKS